MNNNNSNKNNNSSNNNNDNNGNIPPKAHSLRSLTCNLGMPLDESVADVDPELLLPVTTQLSAD